MRPTLNLLAGVLAAVGANHVPGRAFDRFISIWLENQDFVKVVKDSHIVELKKQGISLARYYAQTHPSQANYIAAITGDYFGLDHDERAYMEDMPGPGFLADASDGHTGGGKWDYVRKHNPFVSCDSINLNGSRLLNVQAFDDWEADFKAKKVPQYAFIAPNMMNDGHNTSLEYATKWASDFLKPLLEDTAFKERTLILLTYDESEDHGKPNQVASVLLGSAIPKDRRGGEDKTFYTHYSILSTIEYNWELPNLGRYDVGANVFQFVKDLGRKVLVANKDPPNIVSVDNSQSYFGPLSKDKSKFRPYPPPNLGLNGSSGLPILEQIRLKWVFHGGDTPYDGKGTLFDARYQPQYLPQVAVKHGA
ncbi:putative acid phosphatase [Colletotrichum orbiculare MAFF 240422]|uniref:Acid phosphatase n=1 Tax=Colletotrichum orbiculare (strain 104-T / ATCC 96160 / CBS 514.97 / LARS 414 / MAFF 240422) TaxID=1213857 RepID=A0A484G567_COLOR|nr:putative acid phosphatase [Colletotrichum orbiculare MAFF 240422]